MKNGHSRKNHTSLTEEIGNYPLFYPPQISHLIHLLHHKRYFVCSPLDSRNIFGGGGGSVVIFWKDF